MKYSNTGMNRNAGTTRQSNYENINNEMGNIETGDMKQNKEYYQTQNKMGNPSEYRSGNMGNMYAGMGTRQTEEHSKTIEDVFCELSSRMCMGIYMHEQLADYFCFLGLQGFKRFAEYQYMKECAEKRDLHKEYINTQHKILPVKQTPIVQLIPSEWTRYKTTDINDTVLPKFVRSVFMEYKNFEEQQKEIFTEQYEILSNIGEIKNAEYVKEMIHDVEKELKKIHRMLEKMNGTGYDTSMLHSMQDKYHEKYKNKYNEKFTDKHLKHVEKQGKELKANGSMKYSW